MFEKCHGIQHLALQTVCCDLKFPERGLINFLRWQVLTVRGWRHPATSLRTRPCPIERDRARERERVRDRKRKEEKRREGDFGDRGARVAGRGGGGGVGYCPFLAVRRPTNGNGSASSFFMCVSRVRIP